jgi:hypothetical protein
VRDHNSEPQDGGVPFAVVLNYSHGERRDHIARLMNNGADAWNTWRRENPDILPDLSRARLGGTHLYGLNLTSANLNQAHLGEAILIRANLSGATLWSAGLSRAC